MTKDPVNGATVDGTFTYNPAAGTIIVVGIYILHVDFIPTYPVTYNIASKDVTINVLTPMQKIDQMVDSVQNMVTSGLLNQEEENALKAKHDTITQNLNAGNTLASINGLNAFINQINAYIKNGVLSQAEEQAFIDEANSVIDALKTS
ncbi:MAG: hypothetical protein WB014_15090 [Methanosarcina sp.]